MSPLVKKEDAVSAGTVIKNRTKFMLEGSPESALTKIRELIEKKGGTIVKLRESELKARFQGVGGALEFSVKFMPTAEFGLSLVEMQRIAGDTLHYQELFREFKRTFGSNVDAPIS